MERTANMSNNSEEDGSILWSWMCWRRSQVYRRTQREDPVRVELVDLPLGFAPSSVEEVCNDLPRLQIAVSSSSLPSYSQLVKEIGAF